MLNYWNLKEVIALPLSQTIQILKRGLLQDEFHICEVDEFFYERDTLFPKITAHLKGETQEHLGTYDRLESHLIHYIQLRDKPYIRIERDDNCYAIKGVPQFAQTHFGLTSWTALCKQAKNIMDCFPPDETD